MITKKGAQKELFKRTKIHEARNLELDPRFPKQNSFIEDTGRYLVAQCSRRGGKSNGLAYRFFKTLERHPGSTCLYLSLTQDSSREILWPVLQEINDKYRLGYEFIESKLIMKHPVTKSSLKLMGADLKNFIKRLKGRKYPGVAIDEAQDFGTHLQSLVDDVLTPSIADYEDGWLALAGTPGPVPNGYFFDITQGRKFGYSFHEWTLLDNPFMPAPQQFIAEIMAKREWTETHPTLLREYRNKWVLDVQSLWIRYDDKLNHYIELPKQKLNYIMGIDIGFNDADAIAIIGYADNSPVTYLIEELITKKQGLTELAEQIQALSKKYDISKMVIDEGGLGKKLAEEMRRRHGIPVHPADKARKQENVELLNDYLRLSKFLAKSASQFAQDSYLVQIDWDRSTPDKIIIKKKPHSDIIDAVLYAFKESPAYTYTPPLKKAAPGSPEWLAEQDNKMWEAELEGLQKEADYERYVHGQE